MTSTLHIRSRNVLSLGFRLRQQNEFDPRHLGYTFGNFRLDLQYTQPEPDPPVFSAVPEPSTLGLSLCGLAGALLFRRRQRGGLPGSSC